MLPASDIQQRILNTYRLTDAFRASYGDYMLADPQRDSVKRAINAIKKFMHIENVDLETYHDLIADIVYSRRVLGFEFREYFYTTIP